MRFFKYHGTHVCMALDESSEPQCLVWEIGCFMLQPMRWEIPTTEMEVVEPLQVYRWLGEIYEMSKV